MICFNFLKFKVNGYMLSKLSRISKDTLIYSLKGWAQRFIGIFLVPIYTRIFSPRDYGVIDLIATLNNFMFLLIVMGTDASVVRYYVDSKSEKDKKITASTGFIFISSFSTLVTLVLVIFSPKLTSILLGKSISHYILVAALCTVPLGLISSYCLDMLRLNFRSLLYAVTAISETLIGVSITIYLVVFARVGIIGIYIAQLTNFLIFSIVRFYLTRKNYGLNFSFKRLKEFMIFGAPSIPLSIANYTMTYTNRYFLKYYAGLSAVGLYGVGNRLASLIYLIVTGFQFAWGPFVFSTYNDENAKDIFSKILDYFTIVICLAVLGISLYAKELLTIFATLEYIEAYKVVPFISSSIVTYTIGGYFAIGIPIAKKTWHYIWISVIVVAANVLLNFLFIKYFGLIGAAISTLLSFIILGVLLMKMSQRYYPIKFHFYKHFIMYIIMGIMIFTTYKFMPMEINIVISLIVKIIPLLLFLIVPYWLKLIGKKEIDYLKGFLIRYLRK